MTSSEKRSVGKPEDESDCDDSAIAFASIDFSEVDFDKVVESSTNDLSSSEAQCLHWERSFAFGDFSIKNDDDDVSIAELRLLVDLLAKGRYAQALRSKTALAFFKGIQGDEVFSVARAVCQRVKSKVKSVVAFIELELLGVSALNLFLQGNYTGPALDDDATGDNHLKGINPHPCFEKPLDFENENAGNDEEQQTEFKKSKRATKYHNAVLAELAVDGEWPVQVCHFPYFLLLARSILMTLADPQCAGWSPAMTNGGLENAPSILTKLSDLLGGSRLWSARAVVAHERLLQSREPSITLWSEVERAFEKSIELFCSDIGDEANVRGATVMLEWGLAQHHFDREGKGKKSFVDAQNISRLAVEVTGAMGKRTKFQQSSTAQMLVRAKSAAPVAAGEATKPENDHVQKQLVEHSEEGILMEKIKFENEGDSKLDHLTIVDQAILLALCLDVKNSNPADGLTAEEMGAFLSRVLDNHDDWMVYSTALLERSWLEFERSHARERSILQMQALADQHTNRLTITQSTRQSVEESSPVQDRLKNLHCIVYPPRWLMIQDLADRYAGMGVVTSAADLFSEIEAWGDAVDCYRRAGREAQAEKIVRDRLAVEETPRMLEALGDLTKDPAHYEKAIEVSKGRYSSAYIALGSYYFDKGEMESAAENYEKALKIRPLVPAAWFRLGTISMQLKRWDTALRAFSEVVQQEPEESDAWANVAAIHMHNRSPAEAYPALVESLKYARSNWRIWVSKLYACLDLEKYDEAVQACNVLLDLRTSEKASTGVPPLEEKCVRAIVGGALKAFHASKGDEIAQDSSRRTLFRVQELLERISSTSEAEPWVFETLAFFHQQVGQNEKALDNAMKEYRSLQTSARWEHDNDSILKMYLVVGKIAKMYQDDGTKENLTKARFIVRGAVKKIDAARPGDETLPKEVDQLRKLLEEIELALKKD